MTRRGASAALILALAAPPAGAFTLALPVDCEPGRDCVVQNYFDADPGPGTRDFSCGPLSYDGHDGTDFRLGTLADQAAGVDVLAAAPGVVVGIRDAMPDILQGWTGAPDLQGRDCGNGVSIRHEDGWETQYCHMALGSIAVATGDVVATGDRLGRIGLSGNSQFPHLHLTVRRDGQELDPFDPETTASCGEAAPAGLWADDLAYLPGGLLDAGFATDVPSFEAVQSGDAAQAPLADAPLVVWGYMFGARAGDQMRLVIEGPEGQVIDGSEALERDQAQLFRAIGRRPPPGGWPAGRYTGEVTLIRDGVAIDIAKIAAAQID